MVPPRYGFDIETDTRAGGLDPHLAGIVAVAVSSEGSDRVFEGPEASLLRAVDEYLATLHPGIIVTWNGSGFDLPFIVRRAAMHGLRIGLRLRDDRSARLRDPMPGLVHPQLAVWHQHRHLDGYRLYRADVGRTLGLSCALKAIAKTVGLPAITVDASRLHLLSAEEVAAYVSSDARLARQLVDRRLPAALRALDRLPEPERQDPLDECHSLVAH